MTTRLKHLKIGSITDRPIEISAHKTSYKIYPCQAFYMAGFGDGYETHSSLERSLMYCLPVLFFLINSDAYYVLTIARIKHVQK